MNLQNFCQRGGLALLALGVAGYAGLATVRPAPAPAPKVAVPRAEAAALPASPVIPPRVAAPAQEPPLAIPVSVAVNMPVMPQAAAPPVPVQAVLVTTCPMSLAAPAPPRPFRHVWEPRPHRWSRASVLHAGTRGERGRSTTHAARADAAPYAARGWSDRRVD